MVPFSVVTSDNSVTNGAKVGTNEASQSSPTPFSIRPAFWRATMSSIQNDTSSEIDLLKQENELLKIQIEQLKRQIQQWKESTRKPDERIDTLEEIIDERDDDIDTLKKQVDGAP
jgi:peptidoglycan hydrolase CwlO-like protein